MSVTLLLVESNLCRLHPIDMKRFIIQVRNSKISLIRVRVRVRKIYFYNEKHDIEETNTETFMCRSMSATNAYIKL